MGELNRQGGDEMTVQDFFYKGDVRIVSTPKRELSPVSVYPGLIGKIGKVTRISGNKVGIMVPGQYNEWSQYGCFWFEPECLEKVR